MTLDALIMLAGAFVATLPFLGLPNAWDAGLFLAAGVFVIALGIVVRRRDKRVFTAPVRAESMEQSHTSPTDIHVRT